MDAVLVEEAKVLQQCLGNFKMYLFYLSIHAYLKARETDELVRHIKRTITQIFI
jgi:hypothetical protein